MMKYLSSCAGSLLRVAIRLKTAAALCRCYMFILLVLLTLFCISAVAQSPEEVNKLKKDIKRLSAKLKKVKPSSKQAKEIKLQLADQKLRLQKLEIKSIKPVAINPHAIEPAPFTSIEVVSVDLGSKPEEKKTSSASRIELGFSGGAMSSASGANLEARFQLPYIVGPTTTAMRVAAGYFLSYDMDRRYVPLQVDGMLLFPPGILSGVDNYLGAGLNYLAYTSGRVSGSIGGEIFYGVEGEGFNGKLFGEVGYGKIRTGFSPSQSGITLLAGFRKAVFE